MWIELTIDRFFILVDPNSKVQLFVVWREVFNFDLSAVVRLRALLVIRIFPGLIISGGKTVMSPPFRTPASVAAASAKRYVRFFACGATAAGG